MTTAVWRPTCPSHPGIYIDHHPCHRCPQPEEVPVKELKDEVADFLTEKAIPFERHVSPLASVPDTSTGTMDQATAERMRPPVQPSLSDTLFPPVRKANTPMVKVTISGTVEMTQADYLAYLDGSRIGPGAVVEIRAAGYVVQPGAAWVKRTEGSGEEKQVWHEQEGRIKVKLTELAGLTATGEEWGDD